MSKETVDATLVAAKHVLGHGFVSMNVEQQVRNNSFNSVNKKKLSASGDIVDATVFALKNVLGTDVVDKKREKEIVQLAKKVVSGDKSKLGGPPTNNPALKSGILGDERNINAQQKAAFESTGGAAGGNLNTSTSAARSKTAAATNTGSVGVSGGPGAGSMVNTGVGNVSVNP